MQSKWKLFAMTLMLAMATMLLSTTVLAGGVDPEVAAPAPAPAAPAPAPVFDERVCGSPGSVTQSTTTRWTNIFTTANPLADTGRAYEPNTPVQILGRDYWGCWISVQSASGNGWIPVDAITTKNVMGLPVLVDNRDTPPGAPAAPAPAAPAPAAPAPAADAGQRVCGSPGSTTAAVTDRWTNQFTTADPDAELDTAFAPGTSVTINGRDTWGCWIQVTGAGQTLWIPLDAVNTTAVMGLPVLVDTSSGNNTADGKILGN